MQHHRFWPMCSDFMPGRTSTTPWFTVHGLEVGSRFQTDLNMSNVHVELGKIFQLTTGGLFRW